MRKNAMMILSAAVALSGLHCNAPSSETSEASRASIDEDGVELATPPLPEHCYAQIERPTPGDLVLQIGTTVTLKTGGPICPIGLNEKLAYRYYVEKVDINGNILATRVSPQGPTEWSFTKSTFDTTNLPGPGRYRIYGFSLPRSMVAAWQANDPVARNTSKRTGNAYTQFVTTSWSAGAYGACSASCGGGIETRAVACKDNFGVTRADSWCSGVKPDASQACNETACAPSQSPDSITLGGFEDFGLTNTSAPGSIMTMGPMVCTPMPFPMPEMCMPGSPVSNPVYYVSGFHQDAETVARVEVKITFDTMPTAEGDYNPIANLLPGVGNAFVTVARTIPGSGTTTSMSAAGDALIKVRYGSDNALHALIDDAALGTGGGIQVSADLKVGAPD